MHFWTDNQNCLCWMRNDERNVSGFIQRRVDAIKTKTLLENWRYVDTKKNPADLPSRGLSASELRDSQLWWFGPDYLQSNDESWKQDSFKPEFSQDALKEFIKTRQMVMCNVEGIAEEDEFSEVQSEADVADEVLALTRQQVKARRRNQARAWTRTLSEWTTSSTLKVTAPGTKWVKRYEALLEISRIASCQEQI